MKWLMIKFALKTLADNGVDWDYLRKAPVYKFVNSLVFEKELNETTDFIHSRRRPREEGK